MERFEVHPVNPQIRLVRKAAQILSDDGILIYPTESGYAMGCSAESSKAIHRLYSLKRPLKKYVMALLVPDFQAATQFARIDNAAFQIMKPRVPGPYTFILPAEHRIARKLDVKRVEVGIRMPTHPFLRTLFQEFPSPILNTAAKVSEEQEFTVPDDLEAVFRHLVDGLVDCGETPIQPTNVIRLTGGEPEVIRGSL